MSGFEILAAFETCIHCTAQLTKYAKQVKNAPTSTDMRELLGQVERSKKILESLQEYYRTVSEKEPDLDKYIEENIAAYGAPLKDLTDYVDDYRQPWLVRVTRRGRWPMERDKFHSRFKKIQEFENNIKEQRSLLLEKDVKRIKGTTLSLDNAQVLGHLTPLGSADFSRIDSIRAEHRRKFEKSPPRWVCNTMVFKRWSTAVQPPWLWGLGEAGSGKSSICSFLADELQQRGPSTNGVGSDSAI